MCPVVKNIRWFPLPNNGEVRISKPLNSMNLHPETKKGREPVADSRPYCFPDGNDQDSATRLKRIFEGAQPGFRRLYKNRHVARLVFIPQHFHMRFG